MLGLVLPSLLGLDDLFEAVTSGKVEIRIDQKYPLEQVREAHRALEARKTTGSTILTL